MLRVQAAWDTQTYFNISQEANVFILQGQETLLYQKQTTCDLRVA